MKFRVSVEHRLIGSQQTFDTTATIEAQGFEEAIHVMIANGLRGGHEVIGVSAYSVEDDKAGL